MRRRLAIHVSICLRQRAQTLLLWSQSDFAIPTLQTSQKNPEALTVGWTAGMRTIFLRLTKDIRRFLPHFQYMMCDRSCLMDRTAYHRSRCDPQREGGPYIPSRSNVNPEANRSGSSSDPSLVRPILVISQDRREGPSRFQSFGSFFEVTESVWLGWALWSGVRRVPTVEEGAKGRLPSQVHCIPCLMLATSGVSTAHTGKASE